MMFEASETVFCSDCGCNLTRTGNLGRLARVGCPKCGSKKFDFNISDPQQQAALQVALGGARVPRP